MKLILEIVNVAQYYNTILINALGLLVSWCFSVSHALLKKCAASRLSSHSWQSRQGNAENGLILLVHQDHYHHDCIVYFHQLTLSKSPLIAFCHVLLLSWTGRIGSDARCLEDTSGVKSP